MHRVDGGSLGGLTTLRRMKRLDSRAQAACCQHWQWHVSVLCLHALFHEPCGLLATQRFLAAASFLAAPSFLAAASSLAVLGSLQPTIRDLPQPPSPADLAARATVAAVSCLHACAACAYHPHAPPACFDPTAHHASAQSPCGCSCACTGTEARTNHAHKHPLPPAWHVHRMCRSTGR